MPHYNVMGVAKAALEASVRYLAAVAQHLRPSVPRHHLGREPRAGHRLRRRRLPAGHRARRADIQPFLDRAARPVALHHPAPRARRGAILSGVFEGTGGPVTTGTPIA
jgi:hypothetical protein